MLAAAEPSIESASSPTPALWVTSVTLATTRRSSRSTTSPVSRRPTSAAAGVTLTAHAAERRAIEGEAHDERAAPLEPRGEQDVDRRAAHRAPAERHDEEDGIELSRVRDESERVDAARHRDGANGHDRVRPEALVGLADRRGEQRTGDVVHGHRRGDGGRGPAVEALERGDVNRQPVEAEPEREQRD